MRLFTWSERWDSAPYFFFKDANDRVTDTSEALEEERRLLYVAITRAKEELYISSPQFFRGKKLDISRFLYTVRKDLPEKTSTK